MSDIFGRSYKLTIGKKEFTSADVSLDIKFDVRFARAEYFKEGTVSILGLTFKTISQILQLSVLERGKAIASQYRLKLEAGYGEDLITIIDGVIFKAEVEKPPEMWLKCYVQEMNLETKEVISFSLPYKEEGYMIKDVASSMIEAFQGGYTFEDMTAGSDKIGEKKIHKFGGGELYTLGKAIDAIESMTTKWVCVLNNKYVQAYPRDTMANLKNNTPLMINQETGLLSVSGIDVKNAYVTTFLFTKTPDFMKIRLESKLNPQANGVYLVISLAYKGHYQGNEWYTTFTCTDRQQ